MILVAQHTIDDFTARGWWGTLTLWQLFLQQVRARGDAEAVVVLNQPDQQDARRSVYRLTPPSRDLFGYLVCFSAWAGGEYLHQPSSIRPIHKACGKPFVAQASCSACGDALKPWDVSFQGLHGPSHAMTTPHQDANSWP